MTSVAPLRRYAPLIPIAVLCLVLVGLGSRGALAVFSSQAANSGNTFKTVGCFSGDTGWLNASAQAADSGGDGNGFEHNPTYAFADGSGYAENQNGDGDRHRYYNYGMSISSGCSISGIEVRLDWWLSTTLGDDSMSVELSWNGGSSWTAAKTDTTETTSEHTVVLGGASDTWGHAWTAGELSNSNFRVRLTSNCSGDIFCYLRDFYLDWVPVRVYYAAP